MTRALLALVPLFVLVERSAAQFGPRDVLVDDVQITDAHVADLDGDAILDVVVLRNPGSQPTEVYVYLGLGSGAYGPPLFADFIPRLAQSVSAADFDGDGLVDLVVGSNEGVYLLAATGPAQYAAPSQLLAGQYATVGVADADGDGDVDVTAASILTTPGFPSGILRNDGGGAWLFLTLEGSDGQATTGIYPVDVDGDGDRDVIRASISGIFLHLDVTGPSTMLDPTAGYADVGDLDGDGDPDVVFGGFILSPLGWIENLGSGQFAAATLILATVDTGSPPFVIDVDGDGDLDFLLAEDILGVVRWFENDGAGGFAAQPPFEQSLFAVEMKRPIDLDGDRDVEVVVFKGFDGDVAAYENLSTIGSTSCTSLPNSTGVAAELVATGSRSTAAGGVAFTGSSAPVGVPAVLLAGRTQSISFPAGSVGRLCLGQPFGIFNRANELLAVDASGGFVARPDLSDVPSAAGANAVQPGETWTFQAWFRDFDMARTSNFTSAVGITFVD